MRDAATSSTDACILKVVVGSHAHGLAGPESDKDYRSVFVLSLIHISEPTRPY